MTAPARGEQLALPAPPPPTRYGLVINETRLYSACISGVADWWAHTSGQFTRTGRSRTLHPGGIPGGLVEYGPLTQDDAEFMHDDLITRGVSSTLLKLRPWHDQAQP